jgi:signal transduction histidine kinase
MRRPGLVGDAVSGPRLAAIQFVISACVVLGAVTTTGALVLHQVAQDQALREATQLTRTITESVIVPRADQTLVAGDPAAVARLDNALAGAALADVLVRVKLWTGDGRIVYSDEGRLIGTSPTPSPEMLQVARTGRPAAEIADLSAAENRFEQGRGRLLEVYVPVTGADGTQLVAETYQATSAVTAASDALWRSFLPVLLVALLALGLAQVPLAWWYGHRARTAAEERLELMHRAELARQDERSQIAADLHDSVVQDLAGVSFDLSANANQIHTRTPGELTEAMRNGADVCRRSIAVLRAMLVQLHPGDVSALDLGRALPLLAAGLTDRGVRVDLDIQPIVLGREVRALLYRAAQEGVRNVARHAAATRASISLAECNGFATLLIEDDGQGMTSRDLVKQRAAGHVGLTLLADRVRTRQGELTISSEPGSGTRLTVLLPLEADGAAVVESRRSA